jgi:hypothetical protein
MKEKEEEIRALRREIFTRRFNGDYEETPKAHEYREGKMSLDMAMQITNSALSCLNFLLKNAPVLLSGEDLRGDVVYKCDAEGNLMARTRYVTDATEDDWAVTYVVLFPDKTYEMFFAQHGEEMFDHTPDLSSCEEDAYLYCNFLEKRTDGSRKYETSFAIDIEKGTFLETFEVSFWNQDDYERVFEEVDKFRKEFGGRKILFDAE